MWIQLISVRIAQKKPRIITIRGFLKQLSIAYSSTANAPKSNNNENLNVLSNGLRWLVVGTK